MIKITLPDGSFKEFKAGVTPKEVAESIGARLAKAALAAKVDDTLVDIFFPIKKECKLQLLTFDNPEGKQVFWHSAAHVLAHAIKKLYPNAKNTIGPPTEDGFFYDFDDLPITQDDFIKIEKEIESVVKKDLPTKRTVWSLAEVKKSLGWNHYKVEMAQEFKEQKLELTAYSHGDEFIDLCEGPHVPSTGYIKAFKLTKLAGAYWRGDQKNKQLTRIYGVAFPEQKMLKEYLTLQEEAAKRDHRKIGRELELFMFNDLSPGSTFLLPKGTIIYNELVTFMRSEYNRRGYQEIMTPQIFHKDLWEKSGHWEHYKENMFVLKMDDVDASVKPMNCPGHLVLFTSRTRSYRELPLRFAEFTPLHRNEVRGTLGGLTRVRKFSQDDAHIFCLKEHIEQEVFGVLDLIKFVYGSVFKLEFVANLSTKPDKAIGDPKLWEHAEASLAAALKKAGLEYKIKEKDGAFYGPKIDFEVKDALGRLWQCATCQLDFQMPLRFGAQVEGSDGKKQEVVMIHRAVFGSLERFLGVMIEHYAGKFPLWLSPEQVRVLTIANRFDTYAQKICDELRATGVRVETDFRAETLNKKIREAELAHVNYILVIGEKEVESKTVNVRTRDNQIVGSKKVDEFVTQVIDEIKQKR